MLLEFNVGTLTANVPSTNQNVSLSFLLIERTPAHSQDITAMKPRRWFRFSLRTMFALLTLAACAGRWLSLQPKRIDDREAALIWIESGPGCRLTSSEIIKGKVIYTRAPLGVRLARACGVRPHGPRGIGHFDVPGILLWDAPANSLDRDKIKELHRLFPEATIILRVDAGGPVRKWNETILYHSAWSF